MLLAEVSLRSSRACEHPRILQLHLVLRCEGLPELPQDARRGSLVVAMSALQYP